MTLTDLLEEFNVVIDTHEGLSELRSLILGLAVRGKLVPQDPNDEPASELLKKIEAKKQRLYEKGEIRKPKELPPVTEVEFPFEIPEIWEWCRLGNLYADLGTVNPESKFSYIDVGSIDNSSFEIDYSNIQDIEANEAPSRARRKVKVGSVLYSTVRPYLKNVAIVKNGFNFEPIASTAFEVIHPFRVLSNKYIFLFLLSDQFLDYVSSKMVGVAYPAINKGDMQSATLPLPPLDEQHRIVAKIELLFAEVDELEAQLEDQNKLDEKLQLAVNAEVQQAPDADASRFAWNIITSNFETLYHTPESIDNLKKNILNEAVRGRLVPQDPNDEPACELLKKIKAEKKRLYEAGEIRKPKELPPVTKDEIPFEIPESWEWVRFQNITSVITCGMASTPKYVEEGRVFLSAKNVKPFKFKPEDHKFVSEETYRKITQNAKPELYDLLITRVGAGIGETAIIDQDIDFAFYVSLSLVKPIKMLDSYYLLYWLNSTVGISNAITYSSGIGSSQGNLNVGRVREFAISLPPIEEQHRIVQRIEELFAICDAYKAQLEQREQLNERLVKGLVQKVLEGV